VRRREASSTVLAILVVAYGAFYLCRANLDVALPAIARDARLGPVELRALASVPVVIYGLGKLAMGVLGDALGGKRILLLAIAGSVGATIAFGASGGLMAMIACASLNRFFQAGGWSGATWVVARWFAPKRYGLVGGILSTSYEAGNFVAIALSGAILSGTGSWRALFVVNPLLLAAAGVLVAAALRPTPDTPPSEPGGNVPAVPFARRPAFWVAVILSLPLTFLRVAFGAWMPGYVQEIARAAGTPIGEIGERALYGAVGVASALGLGALSDRLGPARRAPVLAGSLAGVVLVAVVLGHAGVRTPVAAMALVAGLGLLLLGPYSIVTGAAVLDVAGRRGTATAVGIVDGVGYLGGSTAALVLGWVVDRRGWTTAFDVVAAIALGASILSLGWAVRAALTARRG
jgi:sugar phosphate permease